VSWTLLVSRQQDQDIKAKTKTVTVKTETKTKTKTLTLKTMCRPSHTHNVQVSSKSVSAFRPGHHHMRVQSWLFPLAINIVVSYVRNEIKIIKNRDSLQYNNRFECTEQQWLLQQFVLPHRPWYTSLSETAGCSNSFPSNMLYVLFTRQLL